MSPRLLGPLSPILLNSLSTNRMYRVRNRGNAPTPVHNRIADLNLDQHWIKNFRIFSKIARHAGRSGVRTGRNGIIASSLPSDEQEVRDVFFGAFAAFPAENVTLQSGSRSAGWACRGSFAGPRPRPIPSSRLSRSHRVSRRVWRAGGRGSGGGVWPASCTPRLGSAGSRGTRPSRRRSRPRRNPPEHGGLESTAAARENDRGSGLPS